LQVSDILLSTRSVLLFSRLSHIRIGVNARGVVFTLPRFTTEMPVSDGHPRLARKMVAGGPTKGRCGGGSKIGKGDRIGQDEELSEMRVVGDGTKEGKGGKVGGRYSSSDLFDSLSLYRTKIFTPSTIHNQAHSSCSQEYLLHRVSGEISIFHLQLPWKQLGLWVSYDLLLTFIVVRWMALLLSGEALGLFREWYEGRRRARTGRRGEEGKARLKFTQIQFLRGHGWI